ncbi:protein rep, partial [Escherichia coli]|uniref:protein rep n=1 Tax=Escherichia coli TaxID=562 RepID=UPI00156BDFAB
KAAAETLKYAVKPADMVADPDWFREMTRQVHRLRYIATGGAVEDGLRGDEETQEELALADDTGDGTDDGSRLAVNWRAGGRRYRRFSEAD